MTERTVRIASEWAFVVLFLAALRFGLIGHLRRYWSTPSQSRTEPRERGLLVPLLLSLALTSLVVAAFLFAFL